MTHKPGGGAIDVAPDWKPVADKGPGPKRGVLSTSTLFVLRWFHGILAALEEKDAAQHTAIYHRIDRHLRRRGVL